MNPVSDLAMWLLYDHTGKAFRLSKDSIDSRIEMIANSVHFIQTETQAFRCAEARIETISQSEI